MAATTPHNARPERQGRWLGRQVVRALKYLARQEIRFTRWAVGSGVPPMLMKAIILVAKISLLVIVGYAFFWVAVVLFFAVAATWILGRAEMVSPPPTPEWRQGPLGLGLYDELGHRIDPYDPSAED